MAHDLENAGVEVALKWQRDPVAFCHDALESFDPTPQQVDALRALRDPDARVAIRSGHGTGKTTIMALSAIWFVTCFDGAKIPCTAPGLRSLTSRLWPEISRLHRGLLPSLRDRLEITKTRVQLRDRPEEQFVEAVTTSKDNPSALQGYHGTGGSPILVLIDEAPGVSDKFFEVMEGTLTTGGSRILMAGNPTRTAGYFYNAFHKDAALWHRLQFSSIDSPIVTPQWLKYYKEKYQEDSDIYRVRVLGEFPVGTFSELIARPLAEKALEPEVIDPLELRGLPIVLGLDVARFGDDSTVLTMRQGRKATVLWRVKNQDTMVTAERTLNSLHEHKAAAVFVDAGGVGGGVVDRLRVLHCPVHAVGFGNRAQAADKFVNRRVEMWAGIKDWLSLDGKISACFGVNAWQELLLEDLCSPCYWFNSKGQMELESKADMKARGLASPDIADSLALTFASPVHQDTQDTPVVNTGYDPLALVRRRGYDPLQRAK